MQEVPTDGNWESWIITTILGMLGSVVATVVFLSKFIQGLYQSRVTSLEQDLKENIEVTNMLQLETKKCAEDRAELKGECAVLRMRVEQLERNQ